MVGEEMTERGRNGSENFSKSSERVRVLLYYIQSLISWIFSGKRALAQKAEADFFALLRESGIAQGGAIWKEVGNSVDPLFACLGDSSHFRLRNLYPMIPAMMLLDRHLCVKSYLTRS